MAGQRITVWWPLASLYLIMGAGGLWHALGLFETAMSVIAGPLLIVLAIAVYLVTRNALSPDARTRFDLWSAFVVAAGFLVEWAGVESGLIFGTYHYGEVLQPQLFGVPLSIGFAWLLMLLSSLALAQRILPRSVEGNVWIYAPVTGALMVVFDLLMEPAAVALDYWTWGGAPPVQNYIAWFVLGTLFALAGKSASIFRTSVPIFVVHAWLAQALYFLIVNLSSKLP